MKDSRLKKLPIKQPLAGFWLHTPRSVFPSWYDKWRKFQIEQALKKQPASPHFSKSRQRKFWSKYFMKTKLQQLTPKLSISVSHAFTAIMDMDARQAVVYQSPYTCVKVTRQFKPNKRNTRESFVLTIGRPNAAGEKFVKLCQKAGEPFPIRKVQLKFYPKKK